MTSRHPASRGSFGTVAIGLLTPPFIAGFAAWWTAATLIQSVGTVVRIEPDPRLLWVMAAVLLILAVEAALFVMSWPLVRRVRRQASVVRRLIAERDTARAGSRAQTVEQGRAASFQLCHAFAHDLNNILGGILAAADTASEVSVDPVLQSSIRSIFDAVQAGLQLSQRILALDPGPRLVRRLGDVGVELVAAADSFAHAAGGQDRLHLHLAGVSMPAVIDHAQLIACVLELIKNARTASPADAPVVLTSRLGSRSSATTADAIDGIIEVEDGGHGMSPAELARAVEPLFTTRNGALGLGLPMIQNFMRASGGSLELRSQPGRGTRATLRIPLSADDEQANLSLMPDGRRARPRQTRVLIVDDNDPLRATLARRLRESGFQVTEAADAATAIRVLDGQIDALVTDVVLGGDVDGYALARLGRDRDPTVALVFTSGFISARQPEILATDDLSSFMRKPVQYSNLLTVLSGLLATRDSRRFRRLAATEGQPLTGSH